MRHKFNDNPLWTEREFSHPERTIRLGSLFSGIGAIEQALNLMNVKHTNVFACDNGELELKLLPTTHQAEYDKLKKIANREKVIKDSVESAEKASADQERLLKAEQAEKKFRDNI